MNLNDVSLRSHASSSGGSSGRNSIDEQLENLSVNSQRQRKDQNSQLQQQKKARVPKSIKSDRTIIVQLVKSKNNTWNLRFVGGKDTPIKSIIVQDGSKCEYLASNLNVASEELQPGDAIISLNQTPIPFNAISHASFRQILSNIQTDTLTIRVKRFKKSYENPLANTIQEVTIYKRAVGEFLGMKLLVDKEYGSGLFVTSIAPNGLIYNDGRITENDKVLEINQVNVRNATSSEEAIKALQLNSKKLEIKVMKCPKEMRDPKKPLSKHDSASLNKNLKSAVRRPYLNAAYIEKTILITGKIGDPLGLVLAGGVTDRFRLPCFVESILPNTVTANFKDKINKGDLLISANEINLLEKSLYEVTEIFRSLVKIQSNFTSNGPNKNGSDSVNGAKNQDSTNFMPHLQYSIKLKFIQISDYENIRVDELADTIACNQQLNKTFRLSWKSWILTPAVCLRYDRILLKPIPESGYGMILDGGWDSANDLNRPVFITNVQKNSVANQHGLAPGYEITTIEGMTACGMSIRQIDKMMKVSDQIEIEYIAWPATLL